MRIDRFLQAEVELWYFEESERTNDDVKNYIRNVLQPRVDRIISKGGFGSPDKNEAYAPLTGGQKDIIKGQTQLGIDTAENIGIVKALREEYRKGEAAPTSAESVRNAAVAETERLERVELIQDEVNSIIDNISKTTIELDLPVFNDLVTNPRSRQGTLAEREQKFIERKVYPEIAKGFTEITGIKTPEEFGQLMANLIDTQQLQEFVDTLAQNLNISPDTLVGYLESFENYYEPPKKNTNRRTSRNNK
jgi:hypothetical protein